MSLLQHILGWLRPGGTGRRGENAACQHLRRQGYRVLARNLWSKAGEIDLLAEAPDERTIVVVEVKARRTSPPDAAAPAAPPGPPPEVHVNHGKQRRLARLAAQAVRRRGLTDRPVRFDVIGVDLPPRGRPVIRHHVAAFESHL